MSKKHAFVKYTKKGQLIPGSLVITEGYPKETANGVWEEVPVNLFCCDPITTTTVPPALRLLFSDISAVDAVVGDSSNVSDWNSYFDLPAYGSPFTSVTVVGNEVKLYGGSNIIINDFLFPNTIGIYLLEFDDTLGCIIEVGYNGFGSGSNACLNVTYMNLPEVIIAGDEAFYTLGYNSLSLTINIPKLTTTGSNCFADCIAITTINAPQLSIIGDDSFYSCTSLTSISLPVCNNLGSTVGDNSVFGSISSNLITLTVPSALMTADAGNPDGDIAYLQANNTVTVVTV